MSGDTNNDGKRLPEEEEDQAQVEEAADTEEAEDEEVTEEAAEGEESADEEETEGEEEGEDAAEDADTAGGIFGTLKVGFIVILKISLEAFKKAPLYQQLLIVGLAFATVAVVLLAAVQVLPLMKNPDQDAVREIARNLFWLTVFFFAFLAFNMVIYLFVLHKEYVAQAREAVVKGTKAAIEERGVRNPDITKLAAKAEKQQAGGQVTWLKGGEWQGKYTYVDKKTKQKTTGTETLKVTDQTNQFVSGTITDEQGQNALFEGAALNRMFTFYTISATDRASCGSGTLRISPFGSEKMNGHVMFFNLDTETIDLSSYELTQTKEPA